MFATLSIPVTPLRSHRPDLPEGLCDAIMKGLIKDPEHRCPSAKDLAVELIPFGSSNEFFEELTNDESERSIRDSRSSSCFPDSEGTPVKGGLAEHHLTNEPASTLPSVEISADVAAPATRSPPRRALLAAFGAVGVVAVAVIILLASRSTRASAATEPAPVEPSAVSAEVQLVAAPKESVSPAIPSASAASPLASGASRPAKRTGKPAPAAAGARKKPGSPAFIE